MLIEVPENPSGEAFDKERRDAICIWSSLTFGLLLVAYVLDMLQRINHPFPGFFPSWNITVVRFVSGLWAFAAMAMIPYLRRRMLLDARFRPTFHKSVFPPRGLRLLTNEICTFALCEGIGLLGLVPWAINGALYDYYWFAAVALVLFALNFPSRQRWMRMEEIVARANL